MTLEYASTARQGGRGVCGYSNRIWRSHSALTIGLKNVVKDFPLFLSFANVTERGMERGPGQGKCWKS